MWGGVDNSKYVCIKNGLRDSTLKAHRIATFLKIENCIHWLRKIYGFLDRVSKKISFRNLHSIHCVNHIFLFAGSLEGESQIIKTTYLW